MYDSVAFGQSIRAYQAKLTAIGIFIVYRVVSVVGKVTLCFLRGNGQSCFGANGGYKSVTYRDASLSSLFACQRAGSVAGTPLCRRYFPWTFLDSLS